MGLLDWLKGRKKSLRNRPSDDDGNARAARLMASMVAGPSSSAGECFKCGAPLLTHATNAMFAMRLLGTPADEARAATGRQRLKCPSCGKLFCPDCAQKGAPSDNGLHCPGCGTRSYADHGD